MTDYDADNGLSYPAMGIYKSNVCYLCGRVIIGKAVYKDVYCSRECYDIEHMIDDDEAFYRADLKNND